MAQDDDPSYKRRHVVTWERASKGDLDITYDAVGYMQTATVQDNSILNILCQLALADDGHVSATLTYLDWQAAYTALTGFHLNRIYLEPSGGESLEDRMAKYFRLLRYIQPRTQVYIEEAIYRHPSKLSRRAVYAAKDKYLSAIERLADLVQEINDDFACAKP